MYKDERDISKFRQEMDMQHKNICTLTLQDEDCCKKVVDSWTTDRKTDEE